MRIQTSFIAVVLIVVANNTVADTNGYSPQRTAFGQPDMQGTWSAASLTPIERNDRTHTLVVPAPMAEQMVNAIVSSIPDNVDPQFHWDNVRTLNKVRGEYRTSVVVQPENGLIPYTPLGLKWVAWSAYRQQHLFDHPEQRPRPERCFGGLGLPPEMMFLVDVPRLIVQTPDHVVIYTEDTAGVRIIPLTESDAPVTAPSLKGQATGQWQGDTLVVHTKNFQTGNDPARFTIGRAVLYGQQTTVTERFTLLSEQELLYQFTVEDPAFYTQAWSGEFSFTRTNVSVYEYSCHEGNYAMAGILRGNQRIQAELTEPVAAVARPID